MSILREFATYPQAGHDAVMATAARTRFAGIRSLWPFGAIFSLELRQLARRPQTYGLRCVYLGILLAVLSFAWLVMNGDRRGVTGIVQQAQRRAETGRVFFQVFGMFSILAMQLIGPVLTSTAINTERTRRTLDVLLMTPITAWQIVAGKLMSRLWTAVMLLALSLPLLAIVRLLGGVELSQLIGTLSLCAATALGSAAIGLLVSGMVRRAWAVVLLAYFSQFVLYFLMPTLLAVLYSQAASSRMSPALFASVNPMWTEGAILMGRGFLAIDWWPAVAVQVGLALVLTMIAAGMLRRSARQSVIVDSPAREAPPVTVVPIETVPEDVSSGAAPPPLPGSVVGRPGRAVGDDPVLWHELRRPLMTRRWQRIAGISVTLALLAFSYFSFWMARSLNEVSVQVAYSFIMETLLLMTAVVISATAIASEKESDTWTTLIATPLSARAIVYGKFLGIVRRLLWPWVLIVTHFVVFMAAGVISITSYGIVFWTTLTFTPLWIATGLYLSLRCTRPTTAVVLNLMLPLIAFAGVPMILSCVQSLMYPHDPSTWYEVVSYYLPYFYTGTGMVKPGGSNYSYLSTFMLPMTLTRVPMPYLNWLVLGSGLVQLLMTQLMVMMTCGRFDRIVGRARTTDQKNFRGTGF